MYAQGTTCKVGLQTFFFTWDFELSGTKSNVIIVDVLVIVVRLFRSFT